MTGLLRAVLREITATLVIPGVLVTVLPTRGRTAPSAAQPRGLSFELTRSTFLNVDVSPDGRAVVFDLLGDLYLMPITGGAATPLLAGPDWDQAPRFSPDGTMAAFVSDRSGIENIWVVSLATHRPTQITDSDKPVAGTPSWSSDGRELLFGTRGVASGLQVVTVDSHEVRPSKRIRRVRWPTRRSPTTMLPPRPAWLAGTAWSSFRRSTWCIRGPGSSTDPEACSCASTHATHPGAP